ncbi:hypothetical protein [Pseudarthrobacter sp. N5]
MDGSGCLQAFIGGTTCGAPATGARALTAEIEAD